MHRILTSLLLVLAGVLAPPLASARMLTLPTAGAVADARGFDGFGNVAYGSATAVHYSTLGYRGQLHDASTAPGSALVFLRNRYYDPNVGHFTQQDPIRSGTNWSAYPSDPVNQWDPQGLAWMVYLDPKDPGKDWVQHVAMPDDADGDWTPERVLELVRDPKQRWQGGYLKNYRNPASKGGSYVLAQRRKNPDGGFKWNFAIGTVWERYEPGHLEKKALHDGYLRQKAQADAIANRVETTLGVMSMVPFPPLSFTSAAGNSLLCLYQGKPRDAAWGAAGMLPGVAGLKVGKAAGQGLQDVDIALGLSGRLEAFAARTKALSYVDWESSGLIAWGDRPFGAAFVEAAGKARSIHFNLDDFSLVRALNEGGQGGATAFSRMGMNWTSAEFMTIRLSPSLWAKTTFYRGGKEVPKSELIKELEGLVTQ